MNNIILIPFAFLNSYRGGVNLKESKSRLDLYLKNCCVACVSARKNCKGDTDVALVTNMDVPTPYKDVLEQAGVKILHYEFDKFNFDGNYTWSLAFYKLCALTHAVAELEYDNYVFMDSDVFVQTDFADIWMECGKNVLLYDICHGLQTEDYQRFLKEVREFTGLEAMGTTHYGGEFFAANKENAQKFVAECLDIYKEMMRKRFKTSCGDEFITSLAAARMVDKVRNAGAYVYRYWTRRFHLMSTNYEYNPVVVLHVPQEKDFGMIRIYDKYVSHGALPSQKTVWSLLHLSHADWKISLYLRLKSLRG